MASELRHLCAVGLKVAPESSHFHADRLQLAARVHVWGRPQPFGGSYLARCSCGLWSGFFLNPLVLMQSRCEGAELQEASDARGALVGWE
jgi:hypothetical protein